LNQIITKPELQHLADFIEEIEALIDADTDEDALIPLYLIEHKEVIKQFTLEKLHD
jgi:hypothetical protein